MNLGQAVAVCLYELVRQPDVAVRPEKTQSATAGELERITALLYDALCASGYVKQSSSASTHEKVRRMVRRLRLSASDTEIWLGMLRQVLWKLGWVEGAQSNQVARSNAPWRK